MIEKSKREELIELVNRLFVLTDEQQWDLLIEQVFTETVVFDMSSVGGQPAAKMTSRSITENWKRSFEGLDSVYHQSGNFLVSFKEEGHAEVTCYAIAVHYKKKARNGTTREFFGDYVLVCVLTDVGWRINGLRYNMKFIRGNAELD
jgi:hypothetical protein